MGVRPNTGRSVDEREAQEVEAVRRVGGHRP